MIRIRVALALLLCVFASLGAPALAGPQFSQANWDGAKETVRLPNGIRLAFVDTGNRRGEPLLLLHGYTDSSRSWSLVAPHLSKYRLLIPDLRGHGRSDAPQCCYAPATLAEDARLLLDALGIERAAVAGHSLGSLAAMELAAAHPGLVTHLVLIGSTALPPVKRGDWLYENAMALEAPLDPSSEFLREWHPANQPTPVDAVFAEAVRQEFMTIPLHVWHGVIRELAEVPFGRHAEDVKAPVLVLSGGKDPLFPAEHHASLMKAFPHAQGHVFAELGHNPLWEQPEAIAGAIDRFLNANP